MTIACTYCSKPIEHPKHAYQRVQGWATRGTDASRRGGSDVVLREQLHEWSCVGCITVRKSGRLGQGSLSV